MLSIFICVHFAASEKHESFVHFMGIFLFPLPRFFAVFFFFLVLCLFNVY